jgi:hypothetical protein
MGTKAFVGLTATQVFDGYKGLRIDQHCTGVAQDQQILVSPVGAPAGAGVLVSTLEWGKWFTFGK